jgi:hypothetical protein
MLEMSPKRWLLLGPIIVMNNIILRSLFYCSLNCCHTFSTVSSIAQFDPEVNTIKIFDEASLCNITNSLQCIKTKEVLWDTGATLVVTPNLSDSLSNIDSTSDSKFMKGITKDLIVEGIGEVDHKVQTTNNDYITRQIPTYYVSGANQ